MFMHYLPRYSTNCLIYNLNSLIMYIFILILKKIVSSAKIIVFVDLDDFMRLIGECFYKRLLQSIDILLIAICLLKFISIKVFFFTFIEYLYFILDNS